MSSSIPQEYYNKEQTLLKHKILQEYTRSWAQKIASISKNPNFKGKVKLWYVDCFSGPWDIQNNKFEHSSIYIGLNSLISAMQNYPSVELGAIFIEKSQQAFSDLNTLVEQFKDKVEIHTFQGEFGNYTSKINHIIQSDPAFLFIDPKGWTGADMQYIADIAKSERRDLLINVMYEFINRFKDASLSYIPEQMENFFGIDQEKLTSGMTEDELMKLYKLQLKKRCQVKYSADVIVQHPKKNLTKFRLVVGGSHVKVLELFRHVESKIMGGFAKEVKAEIQNRKDENLGQMTLFNSSNDTEFLPSVPYEDLSLRDLNKAEQRVIKELKEISSIQYSNLWPAFLEEFRITKTHFGQMLYRLYKNKKLISINNIKPTERSIKDHHILSKLK